MFRILASALLLLVASCSVAPVPAVAHEAMSGWSYPASCCSDRDCSEVAAEAVREHVQDGFVMTVAPGSHPMWPATRLVPLTVSIPFPDGRVSPDGRFHLCIDGGGKVLCFYAAHGGS